MEYYKLNSLYIEVTHACNQHCRHCYLDGGIHKKCTEMTTEQIKSIFAEFKAQGGRYVIFTGGEPLMRNDVFELLDLDIGKCNMCVAAKNDYVEDPDRPIRVATKFPNIAKRYYASFNREIDIIKLNGSIEIAPLLGLSDVIVDIVETGTTLKENNLSVFEKIMPISARLIANKSSYRFKQETINELTEKLSTKLQEVKK